MIGKILGTGAYVPKKVVKNEDLEKVVDTSDAWIKERTGIERRHLAIEETTSYMAAKAAKRALENAELSPNEVDLILVATSTPDTIFPCVACEVQREIHASNAIGYDINAACSGFLFAYQMAQAYIKAELYKTILIIGADSMSQVVDWNDRSTCILFGDGAGACVLVAKEKGLCINIAHSDGAKGQVLTGKSRHRNNWQYPEYIQESFLHMDGQSVFKFAVRSVSILIEELLEQGTIQKSDINYFFLHQANKRIIESVAKRIKEDVNKFPMNLQEYGNTSAASIPILLDEWNKNHLLQRGDKLVLAGFGAGLSWAGSLLQW